MRKKLPVFILAIVFLLQAFVPAVYASSENETISSNVYLCPFDTPSEGTGKSKWWHTGYVDNLSSTQTILGV
ncbi:hypothetical protein [Tepidibacillus marianensis]|uniref:hypothetical protein n=1 Tax=Tepidibacillus marianensis TaxID=3131995 RepID=UPI0030D3F98A